MESYIGTVHSRAVKLISGPCNDEGWVSKSKLRERSQTEIDSRRRGWW